MLPRDIYEHSRFDMEAAAWTEDSRPGMTPGVIPDDILAQLAELEVRTAHRLGILGAASERPTTRFGASTPWKGRTGPRQSPLKVGVASPSPVVGSSGPAPGRRDLQTLFFPAAATGRESLTGPAPNSRSGATGSTPLLE